MNPLEILQKYYPIGSPQYQLLLAHSMCVSQLVLEIVNAHPELEVDREFVVQAAMLHDIGVFRTNAPSIHCHGELPYICHGVEGSQILIAEGYPKHALVCERHTGTGLSLASIIEQGLPIPHRDMVPISIEEQIVCYADKFYSKSGNPLERKSAKQVEQSLARFGEESVNRFIAWQESFCTPKKRRTY